MYSVTVTVAVIFIFSAKPILALDLGENYDVTTMLKLVESSPGVFEAHGPLTVVARGNARGLPLRRGQTFINASFAGQPCCTSWAHEGWTKLDSANAQAAKPPLDPQETAIDGELFQNQTIDRSEKLAILFDQSEEDYVTGSKNVWRGNLLKEGRIKLSFSLPFTVSNATLGLYLCDAEGGKDTECVAFLLNGYDMNLLRYKALKLGKDNTGPEVETPFGKLKSTIIHLSESTPPTWAIGIKYNFLVERSSSGTFEVRLEGANSSQRRYMMVGETPRMNQFAAILLSDEPNTTLLQVKADPTWSGYFRPGGEIWVRHTPPGSGSAYLGIFMCADRFQEDCVGEVISGHSDGVVRYFTGNYTLKENNTGTFWVAGTEEGLYHITETARSDYVRARWEPIRPYTFAVTRALDGTVRVRLDGGDEERDQRWSTPKEYKHIFIASFKDEGRTHVKVAVGRCGGSTACTAPAPVWVLGPMTGELRSLSLPASVAQAKVCVTIVARVSPGSRVSVAMQHAGGTERTGMGVLSVGQKEETQWLTRRMIKSTPRVLRDKPLVIVVNATQPADKLNPVMVQWVTSCNPESDEDVYTVSQSTTMKTMSASLGFDVMVRTETLSSTGAQPNPACMNGGLLDLVTNKCRCSPGYTGDVCESGCGPNSFGSDCTGRCTKSSAGRQCSGVMLCGAGGACGCASGFGGPRCSEECQPGRFGPGCQRSCGQCKDKMPCHAYTGRCEEGCEGALQPPYCLEECGRSQPVVSLITNGADAKADDFPWHAGVYDAEYRPKSNPTGPVNTEQICGATFVKPKLLISAAHCFFSEDERKVQKPSRYKVALGKTYRGWDDPEKPPDRVQRRDVYWLHIPSRFRGSLGTYIDDIALIELEIPVVTTIYVAPICVDWTGGYSSDLDSTKNGSVVGWGKTENHDPSLQLKVASLPYVRSEECLEQVSPSFWPFLNKDKFCAGTKIGAGVSNGDSGGGMVFRNDDQQGVGAWFLRGIVSVGPPTDLSFTAYSNVTSYQKWLTDLRNQVDIRSALLTVFFGYGY